MKKYLFSAFLVATFAIGFTASDEDLPNGGEVVDNTGIPNDSEAEPNPVVVNPTTTVPNIQTTVEDDGGVIVMRIDMTGVKNTTDIDWLKLYGTGLSNQNVWVEIDGKPKGIEVRNITEGGGTEVIADIVFTIDNSGSMDQEAEAINRDIMAWAQQLENGGLNARFAVVGYWEGPILGARNFCTATELQEYMNYGSGTTRTKHFGGEDAAVLQAKAADYNIPGYYECGAAAIRFANDCFSFRNGATRIYINVTDEPNQPYGNENFSVKFFENQANWPATQGTVHTVFSDYKFEYNNWNYSEQPWLISEYTGGTTQFVNRNASDLDLNQITVTGAILHSYIIRLKDVGDLINDGITHEVHVTIKYVDGDGHETSADKIFYVTFEM